jgi:hypothetical protein
MLAVGAALTVIGYAMKNGEMMCAGAGFLFIGCSTLIYFLNYKYDFCIDYKNKEILASVLAEKEEEEPNSGKISFSSVISAEIMEKEALAVEFGFKKLPSHALVLRGTEKYTVISLNWFSAEQRAEILEKTKKIAGAYL